eukprot:6957946-Prymnesium_polylepis.1
MRMVPPWDSNCCLYTRKPADCRPGCSSLAAVFACELVAHSAFCDLMFINACKQHLLAFMRQLLIAVKAAEINFKAVQRIIGDLINFVTVETNNRDVMTREGLPQTSGERGWANCETF